MQNSSNSLSIDLPFDDKALQNSPYKVLNQKQLNGRTICRYLFDNLEVNAISRAANAIIELLKDNSSLCATFATEPLDSFQSEIEKKKYLVINENAVCLSMEGYFPGDAQIAFKDKYFSGVLLKEPVKCSENHYLENAYAKIWKEKVGDICPAGNHKIGNLVIDQELQEDISNYLKGKKEKEQKDEDIIESYEILKINSKFQQLQMDSLAGRKKIDRCLMAATIGKCIIKFGGKEICISLAKYFAKDGSKEIGKLVAKNIPIVSIVIGLLLGCYRIYKGESYRGCGEIVSGFAACFPGIGTVIALSIDVSIFAYDVYEVYHNNQNNLVLNINDVKKAYELLGLDPKKEWKQEEVHEAFKKQAKLIHPDKIKKHQIKYREGDCNELTEILIASRDYIYEKKRWTISSIEDLEQQQLIYKENNCIPYEKKEAKKQR